MTVSVKRMSAGTGYQYLMRSVAVGDGARRDAQSLTSYYTQRGNPPGRWMGSGLAGLCEGLGVEAGSVAGERGMFHLFGMGEDPVTGQPLGRRYARPTADGKAGAVAGFDVTFSAPKSVSVWWALAGPATREAIVAAHHAAIKDTVDLLEREVAATRVGAGGVAQVAVRGLVAAAFDHWDSRAGDPQLHTHLVVANRAQDAAGVWRTLDSKALYRSVVALSEFYNATLADRLARDLGAGWEPVTRKHSAVPKWEVAGVPVAVIEAFSQRSTAIEEEGGDLVEAFRRARGRQPTSVEAVKLRQQATVSTRPDKEVRSLAELTGQWWARAEEVLGSDQRPWLAEVRSAPPMTRASFDHPGVDREAVAARVLAEVQAKRSTWGRWNVHAETTRQLAGTRFESAALRERATDEVVAAALAGSLALTPPELAHTPAAFRRPDGTSLFRHRDAQRFTSAQLMEAEARLLDASRDLAGPTARTPAAATHLGADQLAAIEQITSSGRVLDVLVGPAGTGKTTALAALRQAWESGHGPGSVVGLAPSATAADVLAAELGIATENTAKWLAEQQRQPGRLAKAKQHESQIALVARVNPRAAEALRQRAQQLNAQADRWQLRPGQLVVIDEASLAGTLALNAITAQAKEAGAKVLLVGDWAQLDAVEAGGAFAMLARDRPDVAELGTVRRFVDGWEAAASTGLRTGEADALDAYLGRGRVRDGDREGVLDEAFAAWLADEQAGQTSLLIAGDAATVLDLNQRAHAERVAAGRVAEGGVELADGSRAAAGDRVVTRRNDRLLSTGRGFVKNGDRWLVTATHPDGSLTARRPSGGATLRLPVDYVAEHVELGYATTAHRAQGSTVDTAHLVVARESMTREALYVGMTRARHANTAHVITETAARGDHHHDAPPATARDVLAAVLGRVGAEPSAHDALRGEQEQAASFRQLAEEYDTIAATVQGPRWARLLADAGLPPARVAEVERSPAFGALVTELATAEATDRLRVPDLGRLVQRRPLADAEDLASVLHERVRRHAASRHPSFAPGRFVVGLIPKPLDVPDGETVRALAEREKLMEQRAESLVASGMRRGDRWLVQLGPPPAAGPRRQLWMEAAKTVAAYRDRYPDRAQRDGAPAVGRDLVRSALQAGRSLASAAREESSPARLDRALTSPRRSI